MYMSVPSFEYAIGQQPSNQNDVHLYVTSESRRYHHSSDSDGSLTASLIVVPCSFAAGIGTVIR